MNLKKGKDGYFIGEEPAVVKDLRRIREQTYEEEKNLTFKELRAKWNLELDEFRRRYGYKAVDMPDGTYRLVKIIQNPE
ncbi:hypothetical protein IH992_20290 [Candidatus Poribacteria bacterium]|nr:hypothetical protein [Candidatus Poribacteria bacterium]